jgi:hypothetical protein
MVLRLFLPGSAEHQFGPEALSVAQDA